MGFADLLRDGAAAAWLFFPSAVLLGALHGLEPGHSKTMMAAFVVAIRGTVGQAMLLALAATVSHTAIVWALAIAVLLYGDRLGAEATEPYFQLASALLIVGVAAWVGTRTWLQQRRLAPHRHPHPHHHAAAHGNHHDGHHHGEAHAHAHSGAHSHGGHSHHEPPSAGRDAHADAHAAALRRRFAGGGATTGQVVLFGLTGGLLPCPAAVTVALLCLQVERFWLGIVLVLCFSIGLALTLIASGVVAALGVRGAVGRWPRLDEILRKLPYFSCAIIGAIGLFVGYAALSEIGVLP